ncbi:hypothetical protein HY798_04100 [Candidatus Falkowbacteria bacterium]|nr:hypothetical protein [Candidatus Falkowbacteria bacterium]
MNTAVIIVVGMVGVIIVVSLAIFFYLTIMKKYSRREIEEMVIVAISSWSSISKENIAITAGLSDYVEADDLVEFFGALPNIISMDLGCPQLEKIKIINDIVEYVINELKKTNKFREDNKRKRILATT